MSDNGPRDGGPAYPFINTEGMSLRDWFAGQALMGMLGNGPGMEAISAASVDTPPEIVMQAVTAIAYQHADAMLRQRKK